MLVPSSKEDSSAFDELPVTSLRYFKIRSYQFVVSGQGGDSHLKGLCKNDRIELDFDSAGELTIAGIP